MNDIKIDSLKIFACLAGLSAFFMIANVLLLLTIPDFNATTMANLQGLFNMNSEVSIPTWYAQILLLAAAILFFVNGLASPKLRKYWYGLSGIFLFLSIDEGSAIHELFTVPVRKSLDITSGYLYYSWFIVYGLAFVFLVAVFLRFYVSLSHRTKLLLFVAAAVFLTGAIGFEAIGASIAARSGETSLTYSLVTVAEESFELLGASLLIYCLLANLRAARYSLGIKF